MSRQPQALDYTSGTVSDSAVTILGMGSALISTIPTGARSFVGVVESAAIRARGDGTSPTGNEGQLIASETQYTLVNQSSLLWNSSGTHQQMQR